MNGHSKGYGPISLQMRYNHKKGTRTWQSLMYMAVWLCDGISAEKRTAMIVIIKAQWHIGTPRRLNAFCIPMDISWLMLIYTTVADPRGGGLIPWGIDFYSGLRKMLKWVCANLNPKTNPGIDFYSGFRKNGQGGGVHIEILKNPGIYFYSGFNLSRGGGCNMKSLESAPPPPLTSKSGSATVRAHINDISQIYHTVSNQE